MLIGAIDADWTKLFQKPISSFSLLFFHTAALSLSLSLSLRLCLCVCGVGEKKGEERRERGEKSDVREMRGKKRKKREKRGGRGLLHVSLERKGGNNGLMP
jgi:hypothetical protein